VLFAEGFGARPSCSVSEGVNQVELSGHWQELLGNFLVKISPSLIRDPFGGILNPCRNSCFAQPFEKMIGIGRDASKRLAAQNEDLHRGTT
jgi:hypothetical protein